MKTDSGSKAVVQKNSVTMRSIFRHMMEEEYYPVFEETHITFEIQGNMAVLEYEEGIMSLREFFSIDEEAYDMFLEASNATMTRSFMVKPVLLDDMCTIMFSFEIPCTNMREFKKHLKTGIKLLSEALETHRDEMRKLIIAEGMLTTAVPAIDETSPMTGNCIKRKVLT